ncbi:DMT family transporter [Actimicrobium antarcticum]|uniref:DMT family transporter n=1 Tax=Actimicrobium antarcticum TaxID=1051899 RepID=A0ABP7T5F8_9BURK
MLIGVACALGAGLLWGLVFIAPLLLPDYPGLMLSLGRYIAFGLIALVPALFDRRRIGRLSRDDWRMAFGLALIGNLIYYATLASAIQLAGAPLPAMLIGTLPIVIAVTSNWGARKAIRWRLLAPSLVVIACGLMLVNFSELAHFDGRRSLSDYLLGCGLATVALAAWTWYPIMNARHLQAHPHISSTTWATAQGLATLPLAVFGALIYGSYLQFAPGGFNFPLGARPLQFILLMLLLGFCASWLGTLLWNRASQMLPTALAGQLIVFETLAALLYAFLLRGNMPNWQVLLGISLLCVGVLWGLRTFHRR